MTGVAGSLSADELLSVARGLADAATVRGVTSAPAAAPLAGLPPSPAVWCSGLRKRYGRQTAVDDVSFTVARGEVLGLLGPNGAGKTSVIKMLLGLVRPDAGEVLLLGRRSSDPRSRSAVGYLPELFRYQPWLTAAEVLALHVRLARVDVPAAGAAGVPGPRRAGRPRRRPGRRVLEGHAAATRAGRRAGRPARARGARRADQRTRPARPGRRARPGARAEVPRRRRPAELAPHRRGRAGLRPRRHPRQGPGGRLGHPRRTAGTARGAAAVGWRDGRRRTGCGRPAR